MIKNLNPYPIKIFSLCRNKDLAESIVGHLDLDRVSKSMFVEHPDGEILTHQEETVRDCDVFLIAHIDASKGKLNDDLIEMLALLYALKSGEPHRVNLVLPYFPYARQDRESKFREPILAAWMIHLIIASGADHITTLKIHNPSIAGIPKIAEGKYMKNIDTAELLAEIIKENIDVENVCFVSPDAGAAKDVVRFAERLGVPSQVAIAHKERGKDNAVAKINVMGEVNGMDCVIVDDMVDTAGTVTKVFDALKDRGARDVYVMCTHGIFSPPALENISSRPFKKVWATDSCIIGAGKKFENLEIVSGSELLARVIGNIHNGISVTELMKNGFH